MPVNHTASISPTRQHKRKKACLFTANFEKSSLARIKKWGWFGYSSVVSLQVRRPVENATAICVSGQSLMRQMDLCGAASAKVVKQLFLPETARSSRSRNCPWVNCFIVFTCGHLIETSIVSADWKSIPDTNFWPRDTRNLLVLKCPYLYCHKSLHKFIRYQYISTFVEDITPTVGTQWNIIA